MNGDQADVFWGEISPCDHLLQFYESDRILLDTLTGFVAEGLEAGESAVVIATPEHLDELDKRLTAHGFNLPDALADGQYIPLDAEQTLDRFMLNGWPDEQKFVPMIKEILTRAKRGDRRVRAFGEMVAILWAKHYYAATIRLEHLWHKLCQSESFSLFCAYPRTGITMEAAESIQEICAVHSRVAGRA